MSGEREMQTNRMPEAACPVCSYQLDACTALSQVPTLASLLSWDAETQATVTRAQKLIRQERKIP